MAKQDDYVRYTIRVPGPLYESIRVAAGDKSVNAEIMERLYASFNEKAPGITISLEVLPFGSKPEKITLGAFLQSFSETIRSSMDKAMRADRAERAQRLENDSETGPTLLPTDVDPRRGS